MKRFGILALGFALGVVWTSRQVGTAIRDGKLDTLVDQRVAVREMMTVLGDVAARQSA